MKTRKHTSPVALIAALFAAVVATSCGKSKDDPFAGLGQTQCVGACGSNNGGAPFGGGVGFAHNRNAYGIPVLNPDDPSGPLAWETAYYAQRGQRVTVSGSYGGWGSLHESSRKVFFGLFRIQQWRLRCDEINTNGRKDGKILTFHGQPAALYASDGVQSYFVGSQGVSFIAQADGPILLGFNAPNEPYMCAQSSPVRITVR